MKIRHKGSLGGDKIELQMTPMIDIVFQLLIFFILTFRVVAQEGDFNIRMPAKGAPQQSLETPDTQILRVRLEADNSGNLARLRLDDKTLATGDSQQPFGILHAEVRSRIEDAGGPTAAAKTMEVEFDCDFDLKYLNVINAIDAISGYKTGSGNNAKTVRLIEKVKFSPPRKKAGS